MTRTLSLSALMTLLALLLIGCPDDDDDASDDDDSGVADDDDATAPDDDDATAPDDDDATSPDDDDATAPDDDDAGPGFVTIDGFVFDPELGKGAEGGFAGVELSINDDPAVLATSDDDGLYVLDAPEDSAVDIHAASAAHVAQITAIDTTIQQSQTDGIMHAMVTTDLIGQMPALLGGVYDATKGTLWIGASGTTEGVVVSLDATNLGSLGFGAGMPAEGNTFGGGVFQVGFLNVEPGDVTITAESPEVACVGRTTVPVVTDTLTYVMLSCGGPPGDDDDSAGDDDDSAGDEM